MITSEHNEDVKGKMCTGEGKQGVNYYYYSLQDEAFPSAVHLLVIFAFFSFLRKVLKAHLHLALCLFQVFVATFMVPFGYTLAVQ